MASSLCGLQADLEWSWVRGLGSSPLGPFQKGLSHGCLGCLTNWRVRSKKEHFKTSHPVCDALLWQPWEKLIRFPEGNFILYQESQPTQKDREKIMRMGSLKPYPDGILGKLSEGNPRSHQLSGIPHGLMTQYLFLRNSRLEVPVKAAKVISPRMPICEHMEESPVCSQTSNLVCGTDGVTYDNECQICLIRLKTKQDIQIFKDGKC
ncbi:serine protease inhibitor Kazal-type 4 isoform X1 [Ursus arctos]|nr:serine protease inhibitor Kazal-type 4 isoform X1 [Ursus arctos]XP_026362165.1 serine protease inhibitor Kazal-type 4 isoform X1 [Ursus arctos]XP_026362167.1 serine protease inhibitor Kazal-type 4 isoform X1 [Ursus arctos]XP_026362168.1 serine protease inhibitor Kazal-type 4 isoform X1 [Ursus arctos]XP_026362170.1 serine protease inhibitor Kazal-type 4 isoform X1 [Ursus arctos]